MTQDAPLRAAVNVPETFKNKDLFSLPKSQRSYAVQYNELYSHRLNVLRSRIIDKASRKWHQKTVNGLPIKQKHKILDIQENEPCYIIGTVFSQLKYKPNVLFDVSESMYGAPPPAPLSYSDPETDQIMLEDESGRVILDGEVLADMVLVTGTVVGVLGMELQPGVFEVVDVVFPEIAPQVARAPGRGTNKIALVSGLGIDPENFNLMNLELLKEFLTGELGDGATRFQASRIGRLIVAGDSVVVSQQEKETTRDKKSFANFNVEAVTALDDWLYDILCTLPVDLMAGESDPCEVSLPQQPLHKAFFPKCRNYLKTDFFSTKTNPSWFDCDGVRLLGTSGQNINDMWKYIVPNMSQEEETKTEQEESRMKLIETTLFAQNIIPTAPDTLWCYPYTDKDPFCLEETPHVYFIGNQPKFEFKKVRLSQDVEVAVIALPRFDVSGEIVVLDLDTLECECVGIAHQ